VGVEVDNDDGAVDIGLFKSAFGFVQKYLPKQLQKSKLTESSYDAGS